MEALEALVLGIVQGLTEWLPVSSSGHLVIAQELLELPAEENLVFDLVVHAGTLVAVCVYFRKELWRIISSVLMSKARRGEQEDQLRKLGLMLLVGTIPIAVVGLLLTDYIDDIFNLQLVGCALVVNAAALFLYERFWAKGTKRNATFKDAIAIGAFQAVSIVPGISRSGTTLGGGLFRGLERETAAVFAFLLSVPTLIGAFSYGALTLERFDSTLFLLTIGFIAAFLTGLASISYLLKAVKAGKLWIFSAYCAVVGLAVVLWTL